MKKKSILWFLICLFVLFLVACGQQTSQESKEAKGMKIVTSFYPVYAMVKEVSGDLNECSDDSVEFRYSFLRTF